ncbi:MAG: thiolase family protein [Nitrososphaerota archaeon]|jgi:acetyl-CoA C-acetyltransferase|nr:thiolase family protein [Nitrososphaerota archaeon]
MQNRPVIVAVGRTKFGEHYGKEPEKLIEEAWLAASNECNLERKELDTCYMADYFLPVTNKLGLEEGFLSELTELHVPMEVTRSFSAALKTACHAIQAGVYSTALVGGIEKMTDRWDKIRDDLMLLEDPWSYYAGGTPEANHELLLRAYIKQHNITGEDLEKLYTALAQVTIKNHANGAKNPYAQYQRKISLETVLSTRRTVNRALGLFDYAPVTDGATALILTNEESAKKMNVDYVYIYGYDSATDYLNYSARGELSHFVAAQIAMQNVLKTSNLTVWDINLWEVYDQSTMMELVSLEDLGYCAAGTAWKSIVASCPNDKGCYEIDGKELYVNMNGGLKADGNPLGATGGAQIHELFRQLTGKADQRQVTIDGAAPRYGGALEFEGFGTKAYVNILGRRE